MKKGQWGTRALVMRVEGTRALVTRVEGDPGSGHEGGGGTRALVTRVEGDPGSGTCDAFRDTWRCPTCARVPPVLQDVVLLQLRQKVHLPLGAQHLPVPVHAAAQQGVHRQPRALVVTQVQRGPAGHDVIARGGRDAQVLDPAPHLPAGLGPPVEQRRHAAGVHGSRVPERNSCALEAPGRNRGGTGEEPGRKRGGTGEEPGRNRGGTGEEPGSRPCLGQDGFYEATELRSSEHVFETPERRSGSQGARGGAAVRPRRAALSGPQQQLLPPLSDVLQQLPLAAVQLGSASVQRNCPKNTDRRTRGGKC
ncbi:hypothetical protein EYF80_057017 [Liparis tanakae]|uniref:Uncharacterized protein n=1 Tax=Liparis tanakae TaxID=230148 RepID=A0A4Z2EVA0_9TELE|nr:hypothetical protein EYF80_057017 [Liparis tanakae]